jgi:arylsulfatase
LFCVTLSGDGLCVGYDSGDAVSQEYKTPSTFKGGVIQFVGVSTEKTRGTSKSARQAMSA